MLEMNKAYNNLGRELVYQGEDKSKWKKNKGIEDLIFVTKSEQNEDCMLKITIPKKIVKIEGDKLSLNGRGMIDTLYVWKDLGYKKFNRLKSIYENATN